MQRDMTQGRPLRVILLYALPLLAGNMLQQLYNVVDTAVVGQFVGKEALAAVGSSFALVLVVNSIIIGLCMGASVVVSHLYGAQRLGDLREAIGVAFLFILAITLLLTVITLLAIEPMLRLFRMPPELHGGAILYLRVLFTGLIFTFIYNAAAFLLRAVGDSRSPLLFLAVAAVANVALDLLFVIVFKMGIFGVAIATVIAQAASALFALVYAARKLPFLQGMRMPKFEREIVRDVLRYSLLTALQQTIMNFGVLLVQGLVNSFGVVVMAAFAACGRIDAFIHLPVGDFSAAISTFVAQNHGAGRHERTREGLKASALCILVFCGVVSAVILLFPKALLSIFIRPEEVEVLAVGIHYLRVIGAFYVLIGFLTMFYGYYRGIGKPQISLVLTIISLGTRVTLAYAIAGAMGEVSGIWWAIPIGWALADIAGLIIYFCIRKTQLRQP